MRLKFGEEPFMTNDRDIGFVEILEIENAQQVRISIDKIKEIAKVVSGFDKIGFSEITITVEKNQPLILGSNKIGIGIAPIYEKEP